MTTVSVKFYNCCRSIMVCFCIIFLIFILNYWNLFFYQSITFFGMTQVVANLVIFLRQFANFIFSLNSWMILVNKVSNDRQCCITSYYEGKFVIFLMKIHIHFEQKGGLELSEKHQCEANKFWQAVKQVDHFSMIFKFYMQVLIEYFPNI